MPDPCGAKALGRLAASPIKGCPLARLPDVRPGAKYAAYIVGAMVIAASAIALDGWSYRHFVLLDVYERDWGRMLRMVGYLPTWIVAAAGAVIADRRIRTWRAAAAAPVAFVLYAATLGGIVDELLKIVIRRERPDAAHGVYEPR